MTPDEINAQFGKTVYRCRPCLAESGLHWYRGTSCPVCDKPACTATLDAEWQQAIDDRDNEDQYP